MRSLLYTIRFFSMVAPVPRLMVQAMVAVGSLAAVLIVSDPERSARALIPLLLLQLFAASSGFMVPARRGHYDLLLTGGYSRVLVAAVHWAVSVLPGAGVWLAVTAVDVLTSAGARAVSHSSGSLLAMTLVSTMPWAATIALPRFTAAIAWLLVAAVAFVLAPARDARVLLDPLAGGSPMVAAVVATLNPAVLIGIDLADAPVSMAMPAAVLSAGSMVLALAWIARHDIPLEAAQ
jgi:hypothetical protein